MTRRLLFVIAGIISAGTVLADEEPRTGFFEDKITPSELMGADGASAVAEVLPPDDELSYQLYVPRDYDPGKPAGLVVWVSWSRRGGSPRGWNEVLIEKNLIAVGANNAGNDAPVTERMLKTMLAPQFVARKYKLDPKRVYVAGISGGARTAMRVAVAQPAIFKGGIYVGDAVFWGDREPAKIDQVRQNRHVFMIGKIDPALNDVKRVFHAYKEAGISQSELILVPNLGNRTPGASYFSQAIGFLDAP